MTHAATAWSHLGGPVIKAGKSYVVVHVCDVFGEGRELKVTTADVIAFWKFEAHGLSGCRTLAGLTGDWRPVTDLARRCLEYFCEVNPQGVRAAAAKAGLVPKF